MTTVINQNDVIDVKNITEKFNCNNCVFKCFKLGDWNRHLLTAKHQKSTNNNVIDVIDVIDVNNKIKNKYICNCGKEYIERSGLWRHKKLCTFKESELKTEEQKMVVYEGEQMNANNAMILQVLKDNKDMMSEIMGLVAKTLEATSINNTIISNSTNCNNTITHNKQFNLNIYLNETCKDAMNMEDFIKDINITNKDLDDIGSLGFSQALSNIIVREVSKIDENKRPFHCLDSKRELFCVKEKGEWIKDTSENKLMKSMVSKIANNKFRYISEWKKVNPEWNNPIHNKHIDYIRITKNLMDGLIPEEEKDHLMIKKTIRNVIKYCMIPKLNL